MRCCRLNLTCNTCRGHGTIFAVSWLGVVGYEAWTCEHRQVHLRFLPPWLIPLVSPTNAHVKFHKINTFSATSATNSSSDSSDIAAHIDAAQAPNLQCNTVDPPAKPQKKAAKGNKKRKNAQNPTTPATASKRSKPCADVGTDVALKDAPPRKEHGDVSVQLLTGGCLLTSMHGTISVLFFMLKWRNSSMLFILSSLFLFNMYRCRTWLIRGSHFLLSGVSCAS